MSKINRRQFIRAGVVGIAGLTLGRSIAFPATGTIHQIDSVPLGLTGTNISRVGLGTGTIGNNKASNQTRLGMKQFIELARHSYERGISYFDMAESYGSHPFVGAAMKHMDRDKVTLCTKVWTYPEGSDKIEPVDQLLDRYRLDLDTDYIDILLMHCLMEGNWTESRKYYIDALSEAKEKGIVKHVGVSCHNWDALEEAIDNPWVDVILARINPFQTHMDGAPEDINGLLARARENGKGIIGMKIFGEGLNITEEERQRSLQFAIDKANIDCMTIGLESIEQVDDLIEKIAGIINI